MCNATRRRHNINIKHSMSLALGIDPREKINIVVMGHETKACKSFSGQKSDELF